MQNVMWNCLSSLMKQREEASLEMESSIGVSLAIWSYAEEIGSEVRHMDLRFLSLLPSTMKF